MWVMTPEGIGILRHFSGIEASKEVIGNPTAEGYRQTMGTLRPWYYLGHEFDCEVHLIKKDGTTKIRVVEDPDGNPILVSGSWFKLEQLRQADLIEIPQERRQHSDLARMVALGYARPEDVA
jgi:hypothetical protein